MHALGSIITSGSPGGSRTLVGRTEEIGSPLKSCRITCCGSQRRKKTSDHDQQRIDPVFELITELIRRLGSARNVRSADHFTPGRRTELTRR